MKIETKLTLTIKDQTLELTREEAEELYLSLRIELDKKPIISIPFSSPVFPNFNTPVQCKDYKIPQSPTISAPDYPYSISVASEDEEYISCY